MPDKPDERLIILLPPDLLEEVRRAAEEADLSVSQLVRRAIRNELKFIAADKVGQVPLSMVNFFHAWTEANSSKPEGKISDLVGGLGRIAGTEGPEDKKHVIAGRNRNTK
jgi:Ribbon-helix-helix protein, copG family